MAIFKKFKMVGKKFGKKACKFTGTVSSNINSVNSAVVEKAKISKLEKEKKSLEDEINLAYAKIGKKYVETAILTDDVQDIGVMDILDLLDPKLTRKREIEKKLIEIEKKIKAQQSSKEKEEVVKEFEEKKAKLKKALDLDIINESEFNEKVATLSKRVEKFEEIRRYEKQYDMGIISLEEKNEKIEALLA